MGRHSAVLFVKVYNERSEGQSLQTYLKSITFRGKCCLESFSKGDNIIVILAKQIYYKVTIFKMQLCNFLKKDKNTSKIEYVSTVGKPKTPGKMKYLPCLCFTVSWKVHP